MNITNKYEVNRHRTPYSLSPLLLVSVLLWVATGCQGTSSTPIVIVPTPEITGPKVDAPTPLEPGEEVGISVDVHSNSEVTLAYNWNADSGEIVRGQESPAITYRAPDKPGVYNIRVEVKWDDQRVEKAIPISVEKPTPTPTERPTPMPTPTNTSTPSPTNTPTPSPTNTPTPSPTNMPTPTHTNTPITPWPPVLQDFENEGSYYNVFQAEASLSLDIKHSGNNALQMIGTTGAPGHTVGVYLYNGPVNITSYNQICLWVYDTVGSNTMELRLVNTDIISQVVWSDWDNASDTPRTQQNSWVRMCFNLANFNQVDLSALNRVQMTMWNNGVYYFDDITAER